MDVWRDRRRDGRREQQKHTSSAPGDDPLFLCGFSCSKTLLLCSLLGFHGYRGFTVFSLSHALNSPGKGMKMPAIRWFAAL